MWAVAFSLLAVVAATPQGPTAALSADDVTPIVGQVVHFDASASVGHDNGNGRIVSFEFGFGDGNRTGEQSSPFASHGYSLVGPRQAIVTVEDARGNEGSASLRIDVQPAHPPTGTPDLTPQSAHTIPAQPIEGQTAILSIVESCRRLGVPVKDYLLDILPGMARRNLSEVAHLTPARWAASRN